MENFPFEFYILSGAKTSGKTFVLKVRISSFCERFDNVDVNLGENVCFASSDAHFGQCLVGKLTVHVSQQS